MAKFQYTIKKRKYIFISVLYMVFIFILSSTPANEDEITGHSFTRELIWNLLHIPLFGLLAFLWVKALESNGLQSKKAFLFSIVITAGYSAFDEFHQYFIPGRYATFKDFLLNMIGCIGGLLVYALLANRKPQTANRYKLNAD